MTNSPFKVAENIDALQRLINEQKLVIWAFWGKENLKIFSGHRLWRGRSQIPSANGHSNCGLVPWIEFIFSSCNLILIN